MACGTSFHAAMVGKLLIEGMCRLPVEVDLGSEFRYRDPMLDETSLLIPISQSGETADTRAGTHRRQGTGGEEPGHRQCGGLEHRPGRGLRVLHPCRPGDRGGLHQGLHHPAGGPLSHRPVPGPGPGEAHPGGDPPAPGAAGTPAHLGAGDPGPGHEDPGNRPKPT